MLTKRAFLGFVRNVPAAAGCAAVGVAVTAEAASAESQFADVFSAWQRAWSDNGRGYDCNVTVRVLPSGNRTMATFIASDHKFLLKGEELERFGLARDERGYIFRPA